MDKALLKEEYKRLLVQAIKDRPGGALLPGGIDMRTHRG